MKLLTAHKVRFVVVGGYSVAVHGYVRNTINFDVFVDVSNANARKLVKVFKEFGFDVQNLREELFLKPGGLIRVGHPPVRLEVLTQISGVSFQECLADPFVCSVDGLDVPFINRDLLIQNKLASGRSKDLVDVEHLTRGQIPAAKASKPQSK